MNLRWKVIKANLETLKERYISRMYAGQELLTRNSPQLTLYTVIRTYELFNEWLAIAELPAILDSFSSIPQCSHGGAMRALWY